MSTTKNKKKTGRDTQKALVVKQLAKKYDLTTAAVYQAVRGDSKSELAEEIKREYGRIMKELTNVLK